MAKITRSHQKIFCENNTANIGQFGSAQAGTKVTSDDPAILQNLAAFQNGWSSATISGQKLPTLEEFNGLTYLTTRQIAYNLQEGIPEYSTDTEYHQNSIVKKVGTYELYGSITNNNQGNALTDATNWQFLTDLSATAAEPKIVNMDYFVTGAAASGAVAIPYGGGTPTTSQGTQFMSKSYTPQYDDSDLYVQVILYGTEASNTSNVLTAALFDSGIGTNAVAAGTQSVEVYTYAAPKPIVFIHKVENVGSTATRTFTVRAGLDTANTMYFNSSSGGGTKLGGKIASSITITEVRG